MGLDIPRNGVSTDASLPVWFETLTREQYLMEDRRHWQQDWTRRPRTGMRREVLNFWMIGMWHHFRSVDGSDWISRTYKLGEECPCFLHYLWQHLNVVYSAYSVRPTTDVLVLLHLHRVDYTQCTWTLDDLGISMRLKYGFLLEVLHSVCSSIYISTIQWRTSRIPIPFPFSVPNLSMDACPISSSTLLTWYVFRDRMLHSALNFALGFFGYPLDGKYQQSITIESKGVCHDFSLQTNTNRCSRSLAVQ